MGERVSLADHLLARAVRAELERDQLRSELERLSDDDVDALARELAELGVRSDEPHFGKLVDGKGHIAVWRHRTLVELGYKVVR